MNDPQRSTIKGFRRGPLKSGGVELLLSRYHAVAVIAYLLILASFLCLIADTNILAIPEVLHILFGITAGTSVTWRALTDVLSDASFQQTWTQKSFAVGIFILMQGIVLWGIGTIRLDRSAKRPWRTVSSFISLSVVAAALTFGGYLLLVVMRQVARNNFSDYSFFQPMDWMIDNQLTTLLIGVWIFWLTIGLVYWRVSSSASVLSRIIRALLVTSWIEFSLALPIDIATRNRPDECYCAPGSWLALIFVVPALIFMIGPGLYLLYLGERELSLRDPARARRILRRKSVLKDSGGIKVETYVSNARTLSLIAIALGFVGLELGIFNNQRGSLFSEGRDLVVIRYLANHFGNDQAVLKTPQQRTITKRTDTTNSSSAIVPDSPFGRLEITPAPDRSKPKEVAIFGFKIPQPAQAILVAKMTKDYDSWSTRPFSLDQMRRDRLDQILSDLDITSGDESKIIESIKEKLYSRHIKLPGLDFWDFNTESAVWIVALLCACVLVALRNSLGQIFRAADAGITEPWLVLDAEAFGERVVAAVWLFGIAISGWLVAFGLILSVINHIVADNGSSTLSAACAYIIFLVILAINTWSGTGIIRDLLRIRDLRRLVRDTPEVAC